MSLKKFLRRTKKGALMQTKKGQLALEYTLLVVIAILAFVGANFVTDVNESVTNPQTGQVHQHFRLLADCVTGGAFSD
ncbi:hypothetical protein ACFL38_01965 [Candidatus Omnitrophota bacterium]